MLIPAERVAQRRYVRAAQTQTQPFALAQPPTVLRGLRDLGFRDTAGALCALIDNAIDAYARTVDIVLLTAGRKVEAIAVVDDGVGMPPEMLAAAWAVGETCRLGDGPHLARTGFGLPTAPLAVGQRFRLLSQSKGGQRHGVTFDLDEMTAVARPALTAAPAAWPEALAAKLPKPAGSGTAVILERLDRVTPAAPAALREMLRLRLGYVFQAYAHRITLRVDGQTVRPIDPLFITPGSAGYVAGAEGATPGPSFEVGFGSGRVTVRSAWFPHAFSPYGRDRRVIDAETELRRKVLRGCEGLIVSRLGRRLDVVTAVGDWRHQTNDRAFRMELDFSPDLDADFGPAVCLQTVRITPAAWGRLERGGLTQTALQLRRLCRDERYAHAAAVQAQALSRRRPSLDAIAKATSSSPETGA